MNYSTCENKEIIDPNIYNQIVELKNLLMQSVTTVLFFHTKFKNHKKLEEAMKITLNSVNERIAELKLYIQCAL